MKFVHLPVGSPGCEQKCDREQASGADGEYSIGHEAISLVEQYSKV